MTATIFIVLDSLLFQQIMAGAHQALVLPEKDLVLSKNRIPPYQAAATWLVGSPNYLAIPDVGFNLIAPPLPGLCTQKLTQSFN